MKLRSQREELIYRTALKSKITVLRSLADSYEIAMSRKPINLKFVWIIKDEDGKIVETGNSRKMKFRQTQHWRHFRLPSNGTVHLLEFNTGLQTSRSLKYALNKDATEFREELMNEIIGY